MRRALHYFLHSQSGAITVDWLVLTAGLVGLAILALSVFSDSLDVLVEYIRVKLAT